MLLGLCLISLLTRCWREMDSNHWYRIKEPPFWLPALGPAIRLPHQKTGFFVPGQMVRNPSPSSSESVANLPILWSAATSPLSSAAAGFCRMLRRRHDRRSRWYYLRGNSGACTAYAGLSSGAADNSGPARRRRPRPRVDGDISPFCSASSQCGLCRVPRTEHHEIVRLAETGAADFRELSPVRLDVLLTFRAHDQRWAWHIPR